MEVEIVNELALVLDFMRENTDWLKQQYEKSTSDEVRIAVVEAIADIAESASGLVLARYDVRNADDGREPLQHL